jgi:hypothetical protein
MRLLKHSETTWDGKYTDTIRKPSPRIQYMADLSRVGSASAMLSHRTSRERKRPGKIRTESARPEKGRVCPDVSRLHTLSTQSISFRAQRSDRWQPQAHLGDGFGTDLADGWQPQAHLGDGFGTDLADGWQPQGRRPWGWLWD